MSAGTVETVQLYLKDVEASVEVPRWQLQGIRRIELEPGTETQVDLIITPRQMALINQAGQCILEPGLFEVYIGGSQPDARSQQLTSVNVLHSRFEVVGVTTELEY